MWLPDTKGNPIRYAKRGGRVVVAVSKGNAVEAQRLRRSPRFSA
jgi:hypothetical protein